MIRPLANVHEQLRRLPGIGSKTALRLAYHIIDMPEEEVRRLAETLLEAKRQIRLCDICYNLTDAETCEVCGNAGRDHSVVCVVEQPQDVMAMERSRGYNGVYLCAARRFCHRLTVSVLISACKRAAAASAG